MARVIRSVHLWIGVGLAILFWATADALPTGATLLLSNSLFLAGSTAVAFAYGPVAWRSIADATSPRTQRITLGIFYGWFFGALWRIHTLVWLKAGSPLWFVTNDVIAFYQAGITLGALYHLVSPGAVGGPAGERVPSLKWLAVGGVVGAALFLALVLGNYEVDTTRFVEWLHPYVPGAAP